MPFPLLWPDLDKPGFNQIKGQVRQPVTGVNFCGDVIPDGTIGRDDALAVMAHKAESIP